MIIKLQLARLRQTEWWEYAVRFVFGGVVTVATGLVAKEFGPLVGGLFLAFPGIFPAGITLVERHERKKKEAQRLAGTRRARAVSGVVSIGASLGALGLLAFAAIAWSLMSSAPAWLVIPAATLAWLAASVLLWWLRLRT
jgi:hypothetical protein